MKLRIHKSYYRKKSNISCNCNIRTNTCRWGRRIWRRLFHN